MAIKGLVWIRRDLRTSDHAALSYASSHSDGYAVVFVFDKIILNALKEKADRRVTFIHQACQEIDATLRENGSQLIVRYGDPLEEIPELAKELEVDFVVAASDYEPYARLRDEQLSTRLKSQGQRFEKVVDSVIVEPHELATGAGMPYRVFTPFSKSWRKLVQPNRQLAEQKPNLSKLLPSAEIKAFIHPWELSDMGFASSELWLKSGETAGLELLNKFAHRMDAYGEARDFPAIPGTSTLSVHLRFGTVGVRQAARLAFRRETEGADKWVNELIWRDFYQHVIWHFPHVVSETFQPQYTQIKYPGLNEHFEAWCKGKTGFPIVDAAMRCLNQTGYMHNRLRMIVASFLTKDLLVDYRKGEAYFAEQLLDFDLASNNGGWQWAASTGADAQPYFRIFNPYSQSERFDAEGEFIREWVPELRELKGTGIHQPGTAGPLILEASGVCLGKTYPWPIVDHSVQREKALALLASYKK